MTCILNLPYSHLHKRNVELFTALIINCVFFTVHTDQVRARRGLQLTIYYCICILILGKIYLHAGAAESLDKGFSPGKVIIKNMVHFLQKLENALLGADMRLAHRSCCVESGNQSFLFYPTYNMSKEEVFFFFGTGSSWMKVEACILDAAANFSNKDQVYWLIRFDETIIQ